MDYQAIAGKLGWPLLGAALGCAVTLALNPSTPASGAALVVRADGPATVSGRADDPRPGVDPARVDALAARLAALEERSDVREPEPEFLPEPSGEGERARTDAYWQGLLSSVAREPKTAWSDGAQRSLSRDLSTLARTHGFSVVDTACFATKCKATLSWGEGAAADGLLEQLAHASYDLNCARWVHHDVSAAEDAAQQRATLVLDCAHQSPALPAPEGD